MSPDFQIITRRLSLELIDSESAKELATLVSRSSSLHQWVDWCHPEFTEKEAERFILATRLNWVKAEAFGFGIYDRSSRQLMGMIAINEFYHTFNMASLGYWVADEFQQHGYAKEALDAVIEFCFAQLKLTRLEIVCDPKNLPSQHLATACHAVFETKAANRYLYDGKPYEGLVYSIIPE